MSTHLVPIRRGPIAEIHITIEDDAIVLDGSTSRRDEVDGARVVKHLWSPREGNPAPLLIQRGTQDEHNIMGARIVVAPPAVDGEYYIRLRVVDANGREDIAASYFVVVDGRPLAPGYDKEHPAWIEKAVVYGVILRKFGDQGFAGIAEKLDYLKDLGVDALWLSPINRSPRGDFGYAVVDYFDVNPDFGTKDDFKKLVAEAHARGIRVLMDFVPNHTSAQHPYFQDAEARGTASPYYDVYDRDASGAATHYFNWTHLPNLNYDNPEVERFMIEAFAYWVRDFDVDGFRVDAAWGVKERKPDFWSRWRRELKHVKPGLLLLAEAGARDPYYFDNGFDAAYDWTGELGKWAWERVWDGQNTRLDDLHAALSNNGEGFHPNARIFRFLNNNDTGTRFITDHGEDLTRVATALLLTLPGIPCVYTGDEIGAAFHPYQDPLPLVWNEDTYPGLRDYHKRLIALRKAIPSLHSLHWRPLEARPNALAAKHIYAYVRYIKPADQPVLVVLNFSGEELEVELQLPEEFATLAQHEALHDALANAPVPVRRSETLEVPMPAWGARVLMPRG